jgi:hypothetical protein
MADSFEKSRIHDLFGAFLGVGAAGLLATVRWNVDTSGPDPFYKGPLIFPLLVLSMMVLASLPSIWRLVKPGPDQSWRLDGEGVPQKTLVILGLLVANLFGLKIIGLEASTLLFLVIGLWYLGRRRPAELIVLPLVVTGLLVLVFKHFLDVWFPAPLILEWLGWGG